MSEKSLETQKSRTESVEEGHLAPDIIRKHFVSGHSLLAWLFHFHAIFLWKTEIIHSNSSILTGMGLRPNKETVHMGMIPTDF